MQAAEFSDGGCAVLAVAGVLAASERGGVVEVAIDRNRDDTGLLGVGIGQVVEEGVLMQNKGFVEAEMVLFDKGFSV